MSDRVAFVRDFHAEHIRRERAFMERIATKLFQNCQDSGNIFWMRDGKPHWETCKGCQGRGVK